MNPRTGEVYEGQAVNEALGRGEPLVPISERAAQVLKDGHTFQAFSKKKQARIRNRAARRSRKRNR